MSESISQSARDSLFTHARTHNGWLDKPVSDSLLHEIYDLMKMGPTSANCSPARILFVRTPEGKEKLRPTLSSGRPRKNPARAGDRHRGLGSRLLRSPADAVPPRRCPQLVHLQSAAGGRDRLSQQLSARRHI